MRAKWDALSPQKKKTSVLTLGLIGVGIVSWGLVSFSQSGEPAPKTKSRPISQTILTGRDTKSLGLDGLLADIKQLRKELNEVRNSVPKDLKSTPAAPQGNAAPELAAAYPETKAMPPAAPPLPVDLPSAPQAKEQVRRPQKIQSFGDDEEAGPKKPQQVLEDEADMADQVGGSGSKKKTQHSRFVLPAGSMIQGVLLTGLDAPTANHAMQQPFPALVRIKHEALLPNRFRSDVRECFLIASAYGDLSSERAYLRGESISCVRDDGSIMEAQIDAFAAGEDGKNGIRGRLVSKQGQMIAQALMGGFVSGIANIYQPARVPTLTLNPSSPAASYSRPDPAMAVEEGMSGGMRAAANTVAQYYIEMARNTFPVLEVDAGRSVTFVVSRSANITTRQQPKGAAQPNSLGQVVKQGATQLSSFGNPQAGSGQIGQGGQFR